MHSKNTEDFYLLLLLDGMVWDGMGMVWVG